MAIELADNIQTGAPKPTDSRYLNNLVPYTGVTEVNSLITGGVGGIRYTGLTVNINNVEYWYKDGIADIDLVEKTSGTGNSVLAWTGSTSNAVGTYMSTSGICAQPNLTFNGSTLNVTGNVNASTYVCSPIITGSTCIISPIICATTCAKTPIVQLTSGAGDGCVLTSNANGCGIWCTPLSGGIDWTGSTVNGIGTYSSTGTICSEPNLTFDGSDLGITGNAIVNGDLTVTGKTTTVTPATACNDTTVATTAFVKAQSYTTCVGTVTSVSALTIATTGTDITSSVANGSTTPVITLCVPTASASNRGALSAANWSTFNSKTTCVGTVTSVTAGNGMTQTGTASVNPTLNVVSHAGSAGTIGTINISANAIGVNLGTTNITAHRGDCGNAAYTHSIDNSQAHSDYMLNSGDIATGTYNFDSNTLVVNSSTHRVGIGTANPSTNLEVRNNTDSYAGTLLYVAQNPTTEGTARTIWLRGETSAETVRIDNYGTGYGLIIPTGNVGIGTAAPSNILEIKPTLDTATGISIKYGAGVGMDLLYNTVGYTTSYLDNMYDNAAAKTQFRMRTAGTPVDAVTILGSGNVGINDSTPSYKLDVNGTGRFTGILHANSYIYSTGNIIGQHASYLDIYMNTSDGSDTKSVRIGGGGDVSYNRGAYAHFYGNENASYPGDMNLFSGVVGEVYIYRGSDKKLETTATGIDITGTATASSTMTATNFILSSDIRLKENIQSIKPSSIDDIKISSFNFKDDKEKRLRYGVIAQHLEKIHPEMVYENEKGYKQVGYIDFLLAKVSSLEKRIEQLEEKLS